MNLQELDKFKNTGINANKTIIVTAMIVPTAIMPAKGRSKILIN